MIKSREELEEVLFDLEKYKRELQELLGDLIAPDYDPAKNPDDELYDYDLVYLHQEIFDVGRDIANVKSRLAKLSKKKESI